MYHQINHHLPVLQAILFFKVFLRLIFNLKIKKFVKFSLAYIGHHIFNCQIFTCICMPILR